MRDGLKDAYMTKLGMKKGLAVVRLDTVLCRIYDNRSYHPGNAST